MKKDSDGKQIKKTGRPRSFDETEVLHQAMLVFWRYGYESTSMAVLSHEMNMSAPSIYAAFGDKKNLFLKALDLYVGDLEKLKSFMNESPSAFDATFGILKASAIRFTDKERPRGCMLASAVASCSAESVDVQIAATRKRIAIEEIIQKRIEIDINLKMLPASASSKTLAGMTMILIQGMSVIARDGGSRKKLLAVAELAMTTWKHV